jgi:chromatin structure-remodeling complex subunit RSC3/30
MRLESDSTQQQNDSELRSTSYINPPSSCRGLLSAEMASTRRNGLPSSCEPCRKSKLRCDHSIPICGRCTRRRQPDLCVYHPAPLTQDPGPRQQRRKRRLNNTTTTTTDRGDFDPGKLRFLAAESTESPQDSLPDTTSTWSQRKPALATPGFLGLTSYSAVFAEHDDCLGADITSPAAKGTPTVNPKQLQVGAQILLLLSQNISFYERVFETRFKIFQGWTLGRPVVRAMFESVKDTLSHWFSGEKGDPPALSLARELFQNGVTPVDIRSDMALPEYISGISNRWETIGLLFSIAGLATSLIPYDDPIWRHVDPKSLANHATAVGDICVQFCDYLGVVDDDPLVWLLLHHTALLSVVYGDSGMH